MVHPLRQHSSYAPRLRLRWARPLNILATLRFSRNTGDSSFCDESVFPYESWPKKINKQNINVINIRFFTFRRNNNLFDFWNVISKNGAKINVTRISVENMHENFDRR